MAREQTLQSGLIIRQDVRNALRLPLFQNENEEWPYTTHGGTIFLVNFRGRIFGITCRHILGDFRWNQLHVTDEQFGRQLAHLKAIFYPSNPREHATESDLLDLAILEFPERFCSDFFHDSAYILDENTFCTSKPGEEIAVFGVLNEKTVIDGTNISAVYSALQFQDAGPYKADVTLRHAISKFDQPDFTELSGISGAPVFNVPQNALCGMVVRATLSDTFDANLYYLDISDICQVLTASVDNTSDLFYLKTVAFPVVKNPTDPLSKNAGGNT